jgi:hypothetical protein
LARLVPIAADLWCAEQPFRFFGLEIGARMTVVRLAGGGLWLHSPIARSPDLAAEIAALGTPAFVVAPNRFHHLYAGEWRAAHPEAEVHVAPGLAAKRPDLAPCATLGASPPPGWADALDQALLAGWPVANEVVFFHRASATLIASDMAFHFGAESAPLTRLLFRLSGGYGRLATTVLERLLVRDRAAFRRSLDRVLAWPIERIVVAHGAVVEQDARAALARAYAWLPAGAA